ncbi:NAD(P)/FAD-dependent oxidoreductase [Novosphingobium profundi]|uniref:NAD(P)/FAD-dependent oxidoreductase n=1 Tax=Novosphingobium profundi TaxID=1774954 RepID=UPI001CFCE21E|nr:FAD-dependent oxidoreductase [Novosphingobium profundi]
MSDTPSPALTRRGLLATGAGLGAAAALSATSSARAQVSARPGAPAINRNLPDVAVVGAGAFGGWAALSLREAGAKVTLVDAYGPGNPRASSGDESRLLRLSYGPREIYTRWARRAQTLWEQRQEEFGTRLFYPNGSLRTMSADALAEQRALFDRLSVPYEVLSPDEVHARWPQVDFSEYETVFYEPTGGVVKAREAMVAASEAFMHKGGTMRIGHAKAAPAGGSAPLTVDGEPLACGAALFACGPWLPRVFPELLGDRIVTPRREIFYVGSPIDDHRYRWEHLPNIADSHTYTAADVDYGTKIAANLRDVPMDPDDGDRMASGFLRAQVEDYVARRFPGLVGQPIVATRVCQVELSDNGHFIIDRHPDLPGVWVAGGGSGHAFKMGPTIGEYLAARVLDQPGDSATDALFSLASHKARTHE